MTDTPPQPTAKAHEWDADRALSTDEVEAMLVASGHPPPGPVTALGEGFDNLIFEAGDLYVRAARRRIAVPDIRQEVRLLPLLAERLPTSIPRPTIIPADVDSAEWPWFAYAPVVGMELTETLARPDPPSLGRVAAELGTVLRLLHDPSWAERVDTFVRTDTLRRTDIPYRVEASRARIAALEREGFAVDGAALHRVLDQAGDIGVLPNATLVHGDLHFRHLLVDDRVDLTGIIDWGDAHIGHPAVDLQAYWSMFDPAERRAFLERYGEVDDPTRRAARVVAVFIGAVLALSAGDFGRPALREAALASLRRTVTD